MPRSPPSATPTATAGGYTRSRLGCRGELTPRRRSVPQASSRMHFRRAAGGRIHRCRTTPVKMLSSRRAHRRPLESIAAQKFHWLAGKTPTKPSVGDGIAKHNGNHGGPPAQSVPHSRPHHGLGRRGGNCAPGAVRHLHGDRVGLLARQDDIGDLPHGQWSGHRHDLTSAVARPRRRHTCAALRCRASGAGDPGRSPYSQLRGTRRRRTGQLLFESSDRAVAAKIRDAPVPVDGHGQV
jgi:hypothetical protein